MKVYNQNLSKEDLKCEVKNFLGEVKGKVELPSSIFKATIEQVESKKNSILYSEIVRWQLAGFRAGLHDTKVISEISGTTRKPYAQKHTGRARQGSLRSPQFRGGAIVFGPTPRSYAYSMPKKKVKVAISRCLNEKFLQDKFIILDHLQLSSHKTKEVLKVLKGLGLHSAKVLFVVDNAHADNDLGAQKNHEHKSNIFLASRNLKNILVLDYKWLNLYDLLRYDFVVSTQNVLEKLEGFLNVKKS